MIVKLTAISVLFALLLFQGITMSSAQTPVTTYVISAFANGGDCASAPFNGVWNSNTNTCSIRNIVILDSSETLTVLKNTSLVFRSNIDGYASLNTAGSTIINDGNMEFHGGDNRESATFFNSDGTTITNNGKMTFIGGSGEPSGRLYTNDVTFYNYGSMKFVGGVGEASGHYTSIETYFYNYGSMKFVGGVGENSALFINVNDEGIKSTFENYCGASLEMIGGSGDYSGTLSNNAVIINHDSSNTSSDGFFFTSGTGLASGILLGNPIQEDSKCYCNDMTIDELLVNPFFTNVIDNRDGSLGVILEGEKKENNLIIASDIGGSIIGGDKADCLIGGDGNDTILGGIGNDQIFGGGEVDFLTGGRGQDKISGGDGNDVIQGGKHNDRLSGGNGDDLIFGEKGNDTLKGNAGIDTMDGGNNNDTCITDADDPAPTTCETIS